MFWKKKQPDIISSTPNPPGASLTLPLSSSTSTGAPTQPRTVKPGGPQKNGNNAERDGEPVHLFYSAIVLGLLAIGIFAFARHHFLEYFGTGTMIAGGAFFVGVLLGFLFGIPYTVYQTPSQAPSTSGGAIQQPTAASQQNAGLSSPSNYRVNTNLEQISDWLTKILVGIGLIQLVKAPPQLWKLSSLLAGGLGGPDVSTTALVLVTLLYFSICGFLIGYIWTRIYLTPQFMRVDPSRVLAELDRQKQNLAQHEEDVALVKSNVNKQVALVKSDVNKLENKLEELRTATLDILQARQLFIDESEKQERGEKIDVPQIEQTIAKLEKYSSADPINRMLHLVLANLHYVLGNIGEAVAVLDKFITARKTAGQWIDDDVASAWFNLACYYTEVAEKKQEPEKTTFLDKAAETLEQCLVIAKKAGQRIFSVHKQRALEDPDLEVLRKSNRVEQILRKVETAS
jgi:hypothetical protein